MADEESTKTESMDSKLQELDDEIKSKTSLLDDLKKELRETMNALNDDKIKSYKSMQTDLRKEISNLTLQENKLKDNLEKLTSNIEELTNVQSQLNDNLLILEKKKKDYDECIKKYDKISSDNKFVKLNVNGHKHTIGIKSLCKYSGFFRAMFNGEWHESHSSDEEIFLDFPPKFFNFYLHYVYYGYFPPDTKNHIIPCYRHHFDEFLKYILFDKNIPETHLKYHTTEFSNHELLCKIATGIGNLSDFKLMKKIDDAFSNSKKKIWKEKRVGRNGSLQVQMKGVYHNESKPHTLYHRTLQYVNEEDAIGESEDE